MLLVEDPPVDLATPSGPMRTYVYRPIAPGRYPGVVFYTEIFQRTPPMHRIAQLLAGHGFVVAMPEIFHELEPAGCVIAYDQADRGNRDKATKRPAAHDADARAVLDHLASRADCTGKLGAFGVCIGGHLAFRAALQPDVAATACFYATNLHDASLGGGDDSLARATEIRGELLLAWGHQDPHIPVAGRAAIHARLVEAKLGFSWHEYDAQHAFLRDEGPRYDPALALASYGQIVDLFRRRLA